MAFPIYEDQAFSAYRNQDDVEEGEIDSNALWIKQESVMIEWLIAWNFGQPLGVSESKRHYDIAP